MTKRAQELIAMTFWHQNQLPVTVLRLTAVIGPEGSGGGRSWRAFARMLAEGERVEIPFFSLEEVCHFIDLRDAARMHIVAAENPGAVGEIFNCCGAESTSGAEFAAALQRLRPGIEVVTGFPWSMAQGDVIRIRHAQGARIPRFRARTGHRRHPGAAAGLGGKRRPGAHTGPRRRGQRHGREPGVRYNHDSEGCEDPRMTRFEDGWAQLEAGLKLRRHDFDRAPLLVTADRIKELTNNKEPRLLCFHDVRERRPEIFQELGLFMLPVRNGEYAILRGEGYHDLPPVHSENSILPFTTGFPAAGG